MKVVSKFYSSHRSALYCGSSNKVKIPANNDAAINNVQDTHDKRVMGHLGPIRACGQSAEGRENRYGEIIIAY